MSQSINQEHEDVLNFAHSLPSGLTQEQIYVRIHERARAIPPAAAPALPAAAQPADDLRQAALREAIEACRAQIVKVDKRDVNSGESEAHNIGIENCIDAIDALFDAPAAPAPESQPAAPFDGVHWHLLPGWLIDHCEGDTITEEGLQFAVADMLKSDEYKQAVAALQAPVPAAQEGAQPKQPIIGRLLDELMSAEFLWGLNEPGALMRERDVTRIVLAVGKEYGLLTVPAMEAPSHE